jgi:hypothetical protein
VFGDRAVKMIDHLLIAILINSQAGNVPMIYNLACSATKMKEIGPLVRSALPHCERKVGTMGSYVSNNFSNLGIDSEQSSVVNLFGLQIRDLSLDANLDFSGSQNELMLWNLKLGVSMSHVQRLMKVSGIDEPNGRVSNCD